MARRVSLVRLTRAGEYAIRGMLYLALQPAEALTQIADVAARQGVSPGFLAKIFQELSRAGLVDSHRGAGGGVSLALPAERINIRMVIEAVEGPIALNNCLMEQDGCERAQECVLVGMWREAQEAMLTVFEGATLAELACRERSRRGTGGDEPGTQGASHGSGDGVGSGG